MQIELGFNGTLRITYLNMEILSGLAGLSRGQGTPEGFDESDLSAYTGDAPSEALRVLPESTVAFSGSFGGSVTPASTTYLVSNSTDVAVGWSASMAEGRSSVRRLRPVGLSGQSRCLGLFGLEH